MVRYTRSVQVPGGAQEAHIAPCLGMVFQLAREAGSVVAACRRPLPSEPVATLVARNTDRGWCLPGAELQ